MKRGGGGKGKKLSRMFCCVHKVVGEVGWYVKLFTSKIFIFPAERKFTLLSLSFTARGTRLKPKRSIVNNFLSLHIGLRAFSSALPPSAVESKSWVIASHYDNDDRKFFGKTFRMEWLSFDFRIVFATFVLPPRMFMIVFAFPRKKWIIFALERNSGVEIFPFSFQSFVEIAFSVWKTEKVSRRLSNIKSCVVFPSQGSSVLKLCRVLSRNADCRRKYEPAL